MMVDRRKRFRRIVSGVYYGLLVANKKCPHCGGSIVQDREGNLSCLLCSRPYEPEQESNYARVQRRGLR